MIRSQILFDHLFENINLKEEVSLSQLGLDLLSETELLSRSICRINLAHEQTMQNHPIEGRQAFEEVMPLALRSRNFLSAVAASFYLSRLALYMNSVDRCEVICHHWKKVIGEVASSSSLETQPVVEVPALRGLGVVQGIIFLERNQVEDAEHLFVQSLDILGWGSWMKLLGFVELARLQFLRGDVVRALETLQRMQGLGPQHKACAEAMQIWFELTQSPYNAPVRSRAVIWAIKHTPDSTIPLSLAIGPYHRDTEYICNLFWARVQIQLDHYVEASSFIVPELEIAHQQNLLFRVAELSIAQSLLESRSGNSSAALSALDIALEISESCKYTRFFNDGPELDRLLKLAIERKIHSPYAKFLLTSFDRESSGSRAPGITVREKKNKWVLLIH